MTYDDVTKALAAAGFLKGSVHENVMFPPDAVRPNERLKAGPGKPDPWRTSRVTGRV